MLARFVCACYYTFFVVLSFTKNKHLYVLLKIGVMVFGIYLLFYANDTYFDARVSVSKYKN